MPLVIDELYRSETFDLRMTLVAGILQFDVELSLNIL